MDSAFEKLLDLPKGSLEDINEIALKYIQNGVEVGYYHDGEPDTEIVQLIDYDNVNNNSFICANQWTFIEKENCQPDIVLFVNGFPLVLIELKSPSRSQTDASEGYLQIQRYKKDIPSFFNYNQICVISDMATSKAGTITSDESRFMNWKTTDGSYESTQFADYKTFFEGMFEKNRLLDIVRNFICYSVEGIKKYKILAAYHQYFAVKKAVESTVKGTKTDGKGGVFWHTQGSGKSLSMVFYAHLLKQKISGLTLVVITDRNDLDGQLYKQFLACKAFLREEPVQADSQKTLKDLLDDRVSNGINLMQAMPMPSGLVCCAGPSSFVLFTIKYLHYIRPIAVKKLSVFFCCLYVNTHQSNRRTKLCQRSDPAKAGVLSAGEAKDKCRGAVTLNP